MDISIESYKKITIRAYTHHANPEAFVKRIFMGVQLGTPMYLYWGNGILTRYFTYNQTDAVIKEYLNGHLPIDYLEFSSMPTYRKEIRIADFVATVIDYSKHQVIDPLTKWIATNFVKKPGHS